MSTIVLPGQTFLDIALVLTGDADNAYEIAKANGMLVSDMPSVGHTIEASGKANRLVLEHYMSRNIKPATAIEVEVSLKIFDNTFDFTFE